MSLTGHSSQQITLLQTKLVLNNEVSEAAATET